MRRLALAALALALLTGLAPPPRGSQVQVSRHFLMEVLRGDYAAAYARLSPEMRKKLNKRAFAATARPLWLRGRQRGESIELYKLGFRIDEAGQTQNFVAFSFAADSLLRPAPEWLEVTFRDTATRAVLGYTVRGSGFSPQKTPR